MQTVVANKRLRVLSDSVGKVVLSISESSYTSWYLNVVCDNQILATSAITFAA